MTSTTSVPIASDRPGLAAWGQLILHELRMVVRDTGGLVIPLGLPTLLMVMSGLAGGTERIPELGGVSAMNAFVIPSTLTMMVALIGIVNMPSFLASYRTTGVLRRLAVTPAAPSMVLVAQVVVSLIQTIVGTALALVIGASALGVVAPGNLAGTALAMVLTVAAMYALGMLIAAVAPTANSSVAIGLVTFFATMALGGGLGGRDNLPGVLATIGEYVPYGSAVEALSAGWQGNAPNLAHLAALAICTVLASGIAAKVFRWE
ncbi:ABC transporter permease [Actinopolymorpha alba]|uniref:ABC transporter permease n=1 Tax=Actinopolymorpha alba TaxID=533267 RepID=UPI000376FA2A|nr:ABC transporter permease [Actinopolymorpha alba]